MTKYGKGALSMLLPLLGLFGCQTTTLMPHQIGYGECSAGNCATGQGTLTSKELGVSYTGPWDGGEISTGQYQVNFKGDEYSVSYQNGRPVSGIKFYNQHGYRLDFFNGTWQTYYDPFANVTISFPDEGIYQSATGAQYIGRFFAVPTRGVLKSHYQENPDSAISISFANIVFTGELKFNDQSETVILGQENYIIGSSMVSGHYGAGLSKSDLNKIAEFKRRYEGEVNEHNYYKRRAENNRFDFTQLIAVAGAVSTAAYGINTGLTSDSAAELGLGVYSFISDGDVEALANAADNLEFDQSQRKLQQQLDQEVARIEQQYAAKNSIAHQEYLDGIRRSNETQARLDAGESLSSITATSTSPSSSNGTATTQSTNSKQRNTSSVASQHSLQTTSVSADKKATNQQKSAKTKRTRTRTDKIRVEATAYCLQSKKSQKWWCDGPVQKLSLIDSESLKDAAYYVGCDNHSTSRNRSFMASKDVSKGKMTNGVLLYCEEGIESYDRDIAKIYHLSGPLKQARNTYKCDENQVKTCTTLFKRNKGNVPNYQLVERVEEY